MSDAFDLNRLKGGQVPPEANVPGGVPLLGQQVPVLPGISVNNQMVTIYELLQFSEAQFREFVLAVLVHMGGAVYSPPPPPQPEEQEKPVEESSEPDPED